MKKIIALMIVTAAMLSATACNTVKGAGQDVSAAGNAVTDTAQDAKPQ